MRDGLHPDFALGYRLSSDTERPRAELNAALDTALEAAASAFVDVCPADD